NAQISACLPKVCSGFGIKTCAKSKTCRTSRESLFTRRVVGLATGTPTSQGLQLLDVFTGAGFSALLQVIAIDLVLAGDNAIVIGLAAAGLPASQRRRAILVGIIAATILRIGFAAVTLQLLQILGLLLVGGILLLWVCWKMWRELRTPEHEKAAAH